MKALLRSVEPALLHPACRPQGEHGVRGDIEGTDETDIHHISIRLLVIFWSES